MSVIMKADEPRKHERSRNEIQGMRVRLSVSRADSLWFPLDTNQLLPGLI